MLTKFKHFVCVLIFSLVRTKRVCFEIVNLFSPITHSVTQVRAIQTFSTVVQPEISLSGVQYYITKNVNNHVNNKCIIYLCCINNKA